MMTTPRLNRWIRLRSVTSIAAVSVALLLPCSTPALQQDPASAPWPLLPEPIADDEVGFKQIFDGKTLQGWQGDPTYWRVENDSIVGETKPETILKDRNSFIIWRGGVTKDFELKLQYRITRGGNSGINYRSKEQAEPKWTMRGYQFDIDGPDWGKWALHDVFKAPAEAMPFIHFRCSGQNYEELGRQFLALPGQFTRVVSGETQRVIGYLGSWERIDEIARDDWNDVHIIVRDNLMIHILNGYVTSVVIDDDLNYRQLEGQLGMQVHAGPPMKVEFRDIRLKVLQKNK